MFIPLTLLSRKTTTLSISTRKLGKRRKIVWKKRKTNCNYNRCRRVGNSTEFSPKRVLLWQLHLRTCREKGDDFGHSIDYTASRSKVHSTSVLLTLLWRVTNKRSQSKEGNDKLRPWNHSLSCSQQLFCLTLKSGHRQLSIITLGPSTTTKTSSWNNLNNLLILPSSLWTTF